MMRNKEPEEDKPILSNRDLWIGGTVMIGLGTWSATGSFSAMLIITGIGMALMALARAVGPPP